MWLADAHDAGLCRAAVRKSGWLMPMMLAFAGHGAERHGRLMLMMLVFARHAVAEVAR